MNLEHFKVLLVEANEADIILTQEALNSNKVLVDLSIVRDGAETMDYLLRRPPYSQALRPV